MPYIDRKELPAGLLALLDEYGIRQQSMSLEARESWAPATSSGAGRRALSLVYHVDNGEHAVSIGSWGGHNPFIARQAQADGDTRERPLPPRYVLVQGVIGHEPWAQLYAHPDTLARLLPSGEAPELSEDERIALSALRHLNSRGRRSCWERRGWSQERIDKALDSLAAQGFAKRSKGGATKVTTAGRNVPGIPRDVY